MNRNTNSHFSELPSVDISRSIMDRSCSHKTSANVGQVIPIYVDPDIMPGDTVQMDTSKVIRFQTLLSPMMDNIQCDIYFFFVPHRLVWDHWINFMGENSDSAWIPQVEYSVPTLEVPAYDSTDPDTDFRGTILDYMGFPVNMNVSGAVEINALPVRAYAKVMQDWFVSQNLLDPILEYHGDSTQTAVNSSDYKYVGRGAKPFVAGRYADYFSSCLPSPQKGNPVTLPIQVGGTESGVYTSGVDYSALSDKALSWKYYGETTNRSGIHMLVDGAQTLTFGTGHDGANIDFNSGHVIPVNLAAEIPIMEAGFTVNDLRYAFQLQKLLERDARSGSRYIEVIRSHFGVNSPDSRLQRSEYLGGNRFGIVVDQVSNTAQTENDFLGDLGAFSVTSDINSDFTYSATEHGTILGLMVMRYDHTYAQGLQKFWSRSDRFSYYWPVFANIGEQPVLKKEIYLTGDPDVDDKTFGYNEAWADYRYQPNRVSGEMRPYVANGLSSWTLTDDYDSTPSLSDSWFAEDKTNVDRVLAVTSQNANQYWADIYFSAKYTRPMPIFSIPGLIDHN